MAKKSENEKKEESVFLTSIAKLHLVESDTKDLYSLFVVGCVFGYLVGAANGDEFETWTEAAEGYYKARDEE